MPEVGIRELEAKASQILDEIEEHGGEILSEQRR
jgi:antitoxin (DNA-binding transcriptional repressor) of toxin-antitoxin stability system